MKFTVIVKSQENKVIEVREFDSITEAASDIAQDYGCGRREIMEQIKLNRLNATTSEVMTF